MTLKQQIKILCIQMNISLATLAKKIDMSPQNFGQRLSRDSFSPNDLKKMAEVLGIEYESTFTLNDGTKIKM